MKKGILLSGILFAIFLLTACGEKFQEPGLDTAWFRSKITGQTLYLNFHDNGTVLFSSVSSGNAKAFLSNSGTYIKSGDNITFNLKSSDLGGFMGGKVLTDDDDLSSVAFGKLIKFTSAVWEGGAPKTYNEAFKKKLRVKYATQDVSVGKLGGWVEQETVFTGPVERP